jgi:PKD repeat protein
LGCTTSIAKKNIDYYAANAVADNVYGCVPLVVQFTDNSIDGVSWLWDFGDGNISTLQNPSNTYANNGVYTVTLITTFPGNCKDTVVFTNMISASTPIADFFSPTVSGCSPSEITFVNTSTDAVSFLWDFGDGGTATNINPSHIYYIPGDYTIQLIVTNSYGCSDTSLKVNYINVPGTYATFSPSSTSGCQNIDVQFTDSSINAISWIWNFGDGFTASNSNPSHIYQDTGSYTVTLITFDSLGCTSSFTYPTPITIFQTPIANATVSNIIGCSPLLTNFTNLSQYATSYLWLFGDNDSSSSVDVTHSYNASGLYQPQLIAITQNACRDTFSFSTQITAWQTPIASFQLSDSILCNPGSIQLQNTSSLLQNPNYSWDFGNGQTSSSNSPISSYNLPGNYSIELSVINEHGCNDSTIQTVTINPSPVANGTINVNNGCEPLIVTFIDSSLGANNWVWNMGDGSVLNVKDTSYLYSSSGTFNPYLIVSNSFGCSDTSFIQTPIEVYPTPNPLFTSSAVSGCLGDAIQFTDLSSTLNNPTYTWTIGTYTSNVQNPLITFTNSGIFDVKLEVTNDHGCKNQYFASQLIEIFDSIPPAADDILSVSVVNDTQIKIIWKNSSEINLASYEIYRLNNNTLNYDLIHSELNPINSTTAFSSNYIDQGLNTLLNSYTYKVQTIDQCGNKLPIDSLEEHTSINIQAQQSGQNIQVNWSEYYGCTVSNYELYRTQVSTGSTSLIAALPANTTSYLDTTLGCPYLFSYKIIAKDLCGNSYTSESDTAAATPENKLALQQVELIRSTVYNNREILTEWLPPTLSPERVAAYRILRSDDDINYTHIATVPAIINSYIDNTIEVDKQEYYYKILVINDCELAGIESGEGSSILLNGSLVEQKTLLNWTPYKQWIPGVNEYIIERQKFDGTWEQIKVVNGNTTATEVN